MLGEFRSNIDGWTLYCSIGQDSKRCFIEWNNEAKRLVIRSFVIGLVKYDMEVLVEEQLNLLKYQQDYIKQNCNTSPKE